MIVDAVLRFNKDGIELKSGKTLKADIVVLASGCKFTERPAFLQDLSTGLPQFMHNSTKHSM
jgi:hypothetical protein